MQCRYRKPLAVFALLLLSMSGSASLSSDSNAGGRVFALIQDLGSTSRETRRNASDELVKIGEPAVSALAAVVVGTSTDDIKSLAGWTLVRIGEPSTGGLIPLFSYKYGMGGQDHDVAGLLVRIGKPAVGPLIQALDDPDEDVRSGCAQALGLIGDPAAVPALIRMLNKREDPETVCEALGKIGGTDAVRALARFLDDKEISRYAFSGLERTHEQAVPFLVTAAKAPDEDVRKRALSSLARRGKEAAVKPLITALSDKSSAVRQQAIESLGRLDDSRAVEPLMLCLKKDTANREHAAKALGQLRDKRAVPALVKLLKDPDAKLRAACAESLGSIRDKSCSNALLPLLEDKSAPVREQAAIALALFGDMRAVKPLVIAMAGHRWFHSSIKSIGYGAVPRLTGFLKDKNPRIRSAAVRGLAELGGRGLENASEIVGLLIPCVRDPDPAVSEAAWRALLQSQDARVVALCVERLKDRDPRVRCEAAENLGGIRALGDKEIDALMAAVKDPNIDVRRRAANSLKGRRLTRVADLMISALNDRNSGIYFAPIVLGGSRDPRALPEILAALKRKHVPEGSGVWEWPALPERNTAEYRREQRMLEEIDKETRRCAASALYGMRDRRSVGPIVEILSDPDAQLSDDAVKSLVRALGNIADPAGLEAVIAQLSNSNNQVRGEAIEALGKIKGSRAVDALIEAMKWGDEDVPRIYAIQALGKTGDPTAVAPLVGLLSGGSECDGQIAEEDYPASITALGRLGDKSAAKTIVPFLSDKRPRFRSAAAHALADLNEEIELIVPLLQDEEPSVRLAAACALADVGRADGEQLIIQLATNQCCDTRSGMTLAKLGTPAAEKKLMDAYRRNEMWTIMGAYRFFIRKGIPGSEPLLVKALLEHGTSGEREGAAMASDYFFSGNEQLVQGALEWQNRLWWDPLASEVDSADRPKWGAASAGESGR